MNRRAPSLRRAGLLAGVVVLASSNLAFAQGELPATIVDALVELFSSDPTLEVSYESASGDASVVTITNFRIESEADDSGIVIPTVTAENPVVRAEGGFTANRLSFDNAVFEVEGAEVGGWEVGLLEPAIVPTAEEAVRMSAQPWTGFPESVSLRFAGITAVGASVREVELSGSWTEGSLRVAGFDLPLETLGEDPTVMAMRALGLTAIAADLDVAVRVDFAAERFTFDQAMLSVASIGDVDLSMAMSGPGLMAALYPETSPNAAPPGKVDTTPGKITKGNGLTPLTVTPTPDPLLDFVRLTFTDQGLLAIPGIGPILQGGLTEFADALQGEAREEALAAIEGLFGGKQHTITISATPDEPVRFSEIEAAGDANPADIAALLGLRITSGETAPQP